MTFRTFAVWALGVPLTMMVFFIISFSRLFDRKGYSAHSVGVFWSRLILSISGVRVEIEGAENIPEGKPVIFLSNHQGAFDIPVLQGNIPVQFKWVAKKSLFKIPFIGWSMSLSGYIGVDRENPSEAYKSMEEASRRIKEGTSLLIFPEGTRSETGKLLPFKRGGFVLAAKSGVPIVPVAIRGTNTIMKKGGYAIMPSKVTVSFGRPIETGGVDDKTLRNRTKESIEVFLKNRGLDA
ncbi:MAG: 1-acyl-sn-glycerol-3-phosphate acyltransferase [Deltaproteobacteria bacterium]|nr:1-acyl-sn-glycerol-3-phosphate acyltransferase [Deltaproteobacteria bacterium]